MDRRRAISAAAALGGLLLLPPARGQQKSKLWRIGLLAVVSREALSPRTTAFLHGMRDAGYTEGKNFVLEGRFADGKSDRLIGLARDLAQIKVDLIVVLGVDAARAAQRATRSIPIVMAAAADPLGAGLIASLARPGGNITGLSLISSDLGPKHLELLRAVSPKLDRVAVLLNPNNSSHRALLRNLLTAAQKTGVTIVPAEAGAAEDLEQAFATMTRERAKAVIVSIDLLFFSQRHRIAQLAAQRRLLSIFGYREPVEVGGLISYGQDINQFLRHSAVIVDRVLKGTPPGDIPVEQPTLFELVVNLKTAKALDVTIPQQVLERADRIIQ